MCPCKDSFRKDLINSICLQILLIEIDLLIITRVVRLRDLEYKFLLLFTHLIQKLNNMCCMLFCLCCLRKFLILFVMSKLQKWLLVILNIYFIKYFNTSKANCNFQNCSYRQTKVIKLFINLFSIKQNLKRKSFARFRHSRKTVS